MMTAEDARGIIDILEALEKTETGDPYFPRFRLEDIQDAWINHNGRWQHLTDPRIKQVSVDTYKDDKKGTRFFTVGDSRKGNPEEIAACIQYILDERMKGNIR